MAKGTRLERRELYDLVWSEPIKKLAERFGVSDVAVANVCHQMHVPVPGRGYWACRTAGKPVVRISLPLRPRTGIGALGQLTQPPYGFHTALVDMGS